MRQSPGSVSVRSSFVFFETFLLLYLWSASSKYNIEIHLKVHDMPFATLTIEQLIFENFENTHFCDL